MPIFYEFKHLQVCSYFKHLQLRLIPVINILNHQQVLYKKKKQKFVIPFILVKLSNISVVSSLESPTYFWHAPGILSLLHCLIPSYQSSHLCKAIKKDSEVKWVVVLQIC